MPVMGSNGRGGEQHEKRGDAADAMRPAVHSGATRRSLFDLVVGSFLGDHHVVDVALLQAGLRDPEVPGLCLKRCYVTAAAVAHPGSQSAHELMDEAADASLVGNAPLDPLGDELPLLDAGLHVAI